jgi:2-oxo-3-hexenedioate decarboxylase
MAPESLLQHYDSAALWPAAPSTDPAYTLAVAYQDALALRSLRLARGEKARGFKLGFTNRSIWPIYDVYAPIWGTVYDSTLHLCEGEDRLSISKMCQPRIEPEIVFGMRHTPASGATLEDLFDAIEWLAPGFELVQTHLPNWKFKAPDAVADGGLHGRLVVGQRLAVRSFAANACIHLVKDICAYWVRLSDHHFKTQHNPRHLAATGAFPKCNSGSVYLALNLHSDFITTKVREVTLL